MKKGETQAEYIKKSFRKNVTNVYVGKILTGGTCRSLQYGYIYPHKVTDNRDREFILSQVNVNGTYIANRKDLYIYVLSFDEKAPDFRSINVGYTIGDFS